MADLGTDLSCVSDCTSDMAEVSGRVALAQSVARRYQTPRGRLIYDSNYGFDLTGYVNDDLSPADIARIQSGAAAEAEKDERVETAEVVIAVSVAGIMVVTVTLDDGNGPFTLVLSVSEVTVDILSVK